MMGVACLSFYFSLLLHWYVKLQKKKLKIDKHKMMQRLFPLKNTDERSPPEKRTICDVIKSKTYMGYNCVLWICILFSYCYKNGLFLISLKKKLMRKVLEKKRTNGFDWKESEIITVFAIAGPCYTISQLVLFLKFVKWFGYIGTSKINSFVYGVLIILISHLSVFRYLPTNIAIAILVLAMVALRSCNCKWNWTDIWVNKSPISTCNIYSYCVLRIDAMRDFGRLYLRMWRADVKWFLVALRDSTDIELGLLFVVIFGLSPVLFHYLFLVYALERYNSLTAYLADDFGIVRDVRAPTDASLQLLQSANFAFDLSSPTHVHGQLHANGAVSFKHALAIAVVFTIAVAIASASSQCRHLEEDKTSLISFLQKQRQKLELSRRAVFPCRRVGIVLGRL
ncbi:hypothetical protein RFI_32461 [Reticulomyxa filosa]|uniref:Uncharacterized protein n=1 Tax=Reticulomyxa filosa TaxID=46433 RepID=X6LUA5_RETFI|nr:hypothetical protein RFI_32461 [Reticulomyxa filosa]|eukprot:ETO04936.1 hypothetical protein RFI_32461 [Reticulomyxa filosa]